MIIEVLGNKIESDEICSIRVVNCGKSLILEMAEKKVNSDGYYPKYLHLRFRTIEECKNEQHRIVASF